MELIKHFLSTRDFFHVIAVTETWLDSKVDSSSIVFLDDYTLFRRDRNRHGGGVAVFIHNSISATHLSSSDGHWFGKPGKPEYLFCEISVKGHPPCFLAVIYRPPHSPFMRGTDLMDKLSTYVHDYSTKIILGDFNADQLSSSDDANFIRGFIEENGLYSIPYGATHYKTNSDTWLDLCLVDQHDPVVNYWKTNTPFIAEHDLIAVTLGLQTPKPALKSFSFRDYKSISADSLMNYLSNLDWSTIDSAPLDESVTVFQANISNAINTLAPLKTVSPTMKRHPWFTPGHHSLIRERDRLYRRFKRTRHLLDLLLYRQTRDLAHRTIEEARCEYYYDRLSSLSDPKVIWRELEHLGIIGSKKSSASPFTIEELNSHFGWPHSYLIRPMFLSSWTQWLYQNILST